MMVFCTLFDSNYLDKGIVMYRSLMSVRCDFKMYVLAMDEKCKEVLDAYRGSKLVTISVDDFVEEMGLSELRKNRSRGEFCWTCTSYLIDYVLTRFNEPICTYVDSDLRFYSNPQCLIDEMGERTVQIVEHRYNPTMLGKLGKANSGAYCVEFNTFKNTVDALQLLHWWKERCFESCTITADKKGVWGDQGYLEEWGDKKNVSVLSHLGAGMAPWNVVQYRLISEENGIIAEEKKSGKQFPVVFYHYHNINYYNAHKVCISVHEPWLEDRKLIDALYLSYLREIDDVKNELKDKFGIYPLLHSHPGMENKALRKKRNIKELIATIDSPIIPKLYVKCIGTKKQQKYEHLNIIRF